MNNIETLVCISRIVLFGDERAYARIVRDHQEPLRRFFLVQTGGDEFVADELSQETFVKVWQKIGGFRQMSSFSTWLYRVAYNVYLDYLRRTRNDQYSLSIDSSDAALASADDALSTDAVEQMGQKERQQWVVSSLASMPEPARTCLTLFYLDDKSVREISRITQLSEDNVRVCLSRGRRRLKLILEQNNPYNEK